MTKIGYSGYVISMAKLAKRLIVPRIQSDFGSGRRLRRAKIKHLRFGPLWFPFLDQRNMLGVDLIGAVRVDGGKFHQDAKRVIMSNIFTAHINVWTARVIQNAGYVWKNRVGISFHSGGIAWVRQRDKY